MLADKYSLNVLVKYSLNVFVDDKYSLNILVDYIFSNVSFLYVSILIIFSVLGDLLSTISLRSLTLVRTVHWLPFFDTSQTPSPLVLLFP
jgi:hypothetical protein